MAYKVEHENDEADKGKKSIVLKTDIYDTGETDSKADEELALMENKFGYMVRIGRNFKGRN